MYGMTEEEIPTPAPARRSLRSNKAPDALLKPIGGDHNTRDEHCHRQTFNSTTAAGRHNAVPELNVENKQRAIRKRGRPIDLALAC
jgi:hypothetical protein